MFAKKKKLWAHLVQFSAAAGIQALQQNIDQVDKVDKNNTTSPETNGGGGLHMGPIKEYKDNPKEEDEAKDKGGTWNIIANAKIFDQMLSFCSPGKVTKKKICQKRYWVMHVRKTKRVTRIMVYKGFWRHSSTGA